MATSDTGYSNNHLSLEWLKDFDCHSARRQEREYCLLILDKYGSHCTLKFIKYFDAHHIIPVCLPPHTTHFLQPLNIILFLAYKKTHGNVMHAAMQTCCKNVNKIEFLHALQSNQSAAFRNSSIASAFRKTGIRLCNPRVVLHNLES